MSQTAPGGRSLPDWLEPLLDAGEQRALDEWAINEQGISGVELMERAGTGLADLVAELVPTGSLTVVCGKGNNGGDGFVAARKLRELGREVRVLTLADPGELRGDARTNYERLQGPAPEPFDPSALDGSAGIVDAILGTGFAGEPREPALGAIEAINSAGADVIACDVPSGVDASTGEVAGGAVKARATATFNAAKPGLWIAPGKTHAGEVRVIDIGIPSGGPAEPQIGLISESVVATLPRRGRDSTKFAAGSVLVCGGSMGLTGAPCMASESAMRAGAGYVTAMIPASLNTIFESRLLEVMTVPLPDAAGSLQPGAREMVLERLERADALVLGPGLGRESAALEFARSVAAGATVPLLLDADGLNAHAGALPALAQRTAPTVLTPHAGELARLLDSDSSAVGARRLASARSAAATARAVVVLKGDDTLVAEPGGRVGVNRGGAPALATAGTGDVLSGVIGAYLAKGVGAFDAACAGVLVHARAGVIAARELGAEGVIASDVIRLLPRALSELLAAADQHPRAAT
jgi:NAD(P)H-hydrate epimerase